MAYEYRGYWIDIGTPEKYTQVHRDIMDGRFRTAPFSGAPNEVWVSPRARVEDGAVLQGPCFIDEGAVVKQDAKIGPYAVIGRHCHIEERAVVERSIIWADSRISQDAVVCDAILGRHAHIGRSATVGNDAILGDKSVVTDFSHI